jgi:anti-sigma factor RsiW
MVACEFELVSAYFDDELSPLDRAGVEEHLRECPRCAADLQFLRDASEMLKAQPFDDLDSDQRRRLHRAIDEDSARHTVWKIGMTICAAAASILIICGAWLWELPAPSHLPRTPMAQAPQWERMAMTLRAEPITPISEDDHMIHLADARLADWMLYELTPR